MDKNSSDQQKKKDTRQQEIERLHREAVEQGEITYKDPVTGFSVFTELFHRRRGACCNSGCRHCPY